MLAKEGERTSFYLKQGRSTSNIKAQLVKFIAFSY